MKRILFTFLLLSFFSFSHAQFDWVSANNGLPDECAPNDMAVSENGDIYAIINRTGGYNATLYKSVNDGQTWILVNTNGLPDGQWANSIIIKDNTMFVGTGMCGEDLYRSVDFGHNWIPSNSGLPDESAPNGFAVSDNGDIYTIINRSGGYNASLYKSVNDGQTWILVNTNGLPDGQWASSIIIKNDLMFVGTGMCGDDLYRSDVLTLIENKVENHLNVFPNPTSSQLTIEIEQELINTCYTLCDQYGRVVQQGVFENTEHSISVEHLSPGFYFLQVENQPGLTKKIVIQ